jgi:hypothetical protein
VCKVKKGCADLNLYIFERGYLMSNVAFDFLTESFLFDEKYIEEGFRRVSDQELFLELQKYRKHIQENYISIIEETQDENELNVTIESSGKLPDERLLKQLALYIDKVIISDPIFELTSTKSGIHTQMSNLMGIPDNNEVDRIRLAQSAKYMKWTTSLVVAQFIKYLPISLIHEPPKDLPILYSTDNFSSELSEELYNFFYENVKVNNVTRENGIMRYRESDKLSLGTTIAVNFDREHIRKGHIYQFTSNKICNFDEKTGRFKMMTYIPDTISPSVFANWVNHSINRAAISEFRSTLNEAILAKKIKCMYMAKSQFTADLLSQTIAKKDIKSDLANLSMNFELPVLNDLSLENIIKIRTDSGEAFYNFRTELNSKLLNLRGLTNKDELKREIENVSYELNEIQVSEVNKEYRKILRSLGVSGIVLTGSLVTSFFTGGLTLIGAAGALAKGGVDYIKYLNDFKENNSYFLWKLSK